MKGNVMTHKDLLTFTDWQPEDLHKLLRLAQQIKARPADYAQSLAGKSIVALFEKPSLRTRVSFDIGIHKLGGHMVYLDTQSNQLEGREEAQVMGANLACWADAIVARVHRHDTLKSLSAAANIPVINALCDMYHPCQALADYLSLTEVLGPVQGQTLAYVGDGNNVTHSLLIVGALLGCHQVVITPPGYEVDADILNNAKQIAKGTNTEIRTGHDISALTNAGIDVIYTDTWISMGDTTPLETIRQQFMAYQVNQSLMQKSGAQYVMHCQPAHRDLEISGTLMDSDAALLMRQAENRLHAQNAILVTLLG